MKIFTPFILLICFNGFSQVYQTFIPTVRNTDKDWNDMTANLNQISQVSATNNVANAQKEAAKSAALKNNYKSIKIDKLLNQDGKYKAIVINNVSGNEVNKNTKEITSVIRSFNKYYLFSDIGKIPETLNSSPEVLYMDWFSEAQSEYDIFNILILKNINGEIIYEAAFKNTPFLEMLSPLTTSYFMSKEQAISKLKETKDLLELGIIKQEDFDKLKAELAPIILK